MTVMHKISSLQHHQTLHMSCQEHRKPGIPEMMDPVEERFSITLRTINKNFCRSTLVIGDSNTKELVFGTGKGTFG